MVQATHAAELLARGAMMANVPKEGATQEDWDRFREEAEAVLVLSAAAREAVNVLFEEN